MKTFTSRTQKIGEVGEDIAHKHYINNGFRVIERNYTRRSGEIDLVCTKNNTFYFIEVKSVMAQISRENTVRPEENMTRSKITRLKKTILLYLREHQIQSGWQFDLACVYISNIHKKEGSVSLLENIILE